MTETVPRDYSPAPQLLAGRVILVTGAGGGIGHAAARSFAAHGATVILLGRTVRGLERTYDEIVAASHPEPAIYPMDLAGAQPEHLEELAQRLEAELGHLDGLLHNAGELGNPSPIEHYDPMDWMRVMQVNLNAPFLMTRACLPLMRRSADASILFTTSGVGRKARAYWGAYAASKFAVEGLAQTLADELEGEGTVRVNCINPGPVRTRMRAAAYPGEDPRTLLPPEDLMPSYLFLMGPDGRGVHGRSLDAQ